MQGFKNILVLTDFTPASWEALKYGAMFHRCGEASITLLHVVPGKMPKAKDQLDKTVETLQQKIEILQKQMSLNGDTKSIVLNGDVAAEIQKHLTAEAYDLVMIGLNGNGGLNSDLGRNTRAVLQSAGVPVMVLPSKIQSFQNADV